jgi:hypothetical protein
VTKTRMLLLLVNDDVPGCGGAGRPDGAVE